MKSCLIAVWLVLFAGLPVALSADPVAVAGRQAKDIEGWTVLVSDQLLEADQAATERALELLTVQLREVVRVVPAAAVKELRKVRLWFSPEYPQVPPRAEYHPGAGWLRDNKRDPAMEKGIEFTNVRIFERETKRMPNFALHELAHAYHDRVLPQGYGNQAIQAMYKQAKSKGLYDRVERRFGDGRTATERAYAMTTPMEYFAESSEAYFSTNDFFPFTREQLAQHDPEMFALLHTLWSTAPAQPEKTTAAQDSLWKHSGSIWILTTADGANLPASAQVEQFPLLVRLHRDFFDFAQALPNGEDLRISSSTGERLAFEIDEWNAAQGVASIWVRMPLITGNSRQEIRLRWGNSNATRESAPHAVFNEANGYVGVWHMNDPVRDEIGKITCTDTGTTATTGIIGRARHFVERKGVTGGEKIASLPTAANSHSTEVWFRPERPNATLIGWGNEQGQGKVVMQYRSPTHMRMDCYFSRGSIVGATRVPTHDWTQVVHTYRDGETKLFVNGELDSTNTRDGGPLNIRSPARLYLGGWYNNYDYVGDLDEVRISSVVRSPEWIKLQYENQRPNQSLVGPLVQPGSVFSVAPSTVVLGENQKATIRAEAGGAQKVLWIEKRAGRESIVATDRFSYEFQAGRVSQPTTTQLTFQAIYANEVKSQPIAITLQDDLPDPDFTLSAPARWDGRQTIEIVPQITNLAAMQNHGVGQYTIDWAVDDVAVIKRIAADRLILTRAQGIGPMRVTAMIDNGGTKVTRTVTLDVHEPQTADTWIPRPWAEVEQPSDHQFIACDGVGGKDTRFGTLVYAGKLADAADEVFVRVFAGDKLYKTATSKLATDKKYALGVPLQAGLIQYRTEFGTKTGERETVLHSAKNIVCGDAYLVVGQSNAVATDFGKEDPLVPSEWVRTFGAMAGDPNGARSTLWASASARSPGGVSQIGYWGLELGRRLVESEQLPICIINGAVGGTRIDQHQRHDADPTDVATIYGRLLWRVQQAKLTHGIRAVLWHQGENDQGADGPTGGYGYETYRQYFVDLAANWKTDYPNIERYYAFQIWPKACAMGIRGSDNRLREVQRNLPRLFSNLSLMSTVGVKPPGGCHFPAAGYSEFARLLQPLVQEQLYDRKHSGLITAPNLQRAYFTSTSQDEVALEFDAPIVWSETLVNQFHLDDASASVIAGSAREHRLMLKLRGPTQSRTITYLDGDRWNPNNLLYGRNGIAAFTFCDVPIARK